MFIHSIFLSFQENKKGEADKSACKYIYFYVLICRNIWLYASSIFKTLLYHSKVVENNREGAGEGGGDFYLIPSTKTVGKIYIMYTLLEKQ